MRRQRSVWKSEAFIVTTVGLDSHQEPRYLGCYNSFTASDPFYPKETIIIVSRGALRNIPRPWLDADNIHFISSSPNGNATGTLARLFVRGIPEKPCRQTTRSPSAIQIKRPSNCP